MYCILNVIFNHIHFNTILTFLNSLKPLTLAILGLHNAFLFYSTTLH